MVFHGNILEEHMIPSIPTLTYIRIHLMAILDTEPKSYPEIFRYKIILGEAKLAVNEDKSSH